MSKDPFEARRESFEEEYFRRKDTQLVDKLKGVFRKQTDKEGIRQATGITDEQVLENLAALNLNGELMAAFQLYPLIEIAWADGNADAKEVAAVLVAAERNGIARGSTAHSHLENSLKNPPKPDARKAWYAYAEELKKALDAGELATFRNDMLDHARKVAEASGGIFGLAFAVTGNERKVIDAIERALTP